MTVSTGLEQILESPSSVLEHGSRVGLLTNPTGVDRELRTAIDRLHEHPDITLTRLFGPEHGIRGSAQAGEAVASDIDRHTSLPVTSLYTHERSVAPDAFDDIDVLLIDLQDAGVRFYTYLASANSAARRASEAGKRVVVLDRPNPISWMGAFGNRVGTGCGSIVGLEGLPIAHACTFGELLPYLAARDGRTLPDVIPLRGWDRGMQWPDTGLPWVSPSPNLPTLDSIHLYPATCLIEGTSLSEGRGTTLPFEVIGHPALDGYRYSETLASRGTSHYRYRPTSFVPTISKHAGETCDGVQIHAAHRHHPSILAMGPLLLDAAKTILGDQFAWIQFGDHHFIDRLAGGPVFRETMDRGAGVARLVANWGQETDAFIADMAAHLVYGPLHRASTGTIE